MKNKFYEFKNQTDASADLYIYGEIVQEKEANMWTGEMSESDVSLMDFKSELDRIEGIKDLNLYVNSPGGSVFVASTMASMLQRMQNKGTKIHAFVDGLCASASSFLIMVADDINLYKNSIVMIHKPMTISFGNANDLRKDIVSLDKIEQGVMIPLYMSKCLIDQDDLQNLIDNETWLDSNDMLEIFDVNVIDEVKDQVACYDLEKYSYYKNIPKELLKKRNVSNQITNPINKEKEKELTLKLKLLKSKI